MSALIAPIRMLADFALPPRCAGCGALVSDVARLCLDCWQSIDFLTGTGCTRCGVPMEIAGQVCGPCIASPPRHDGVRAATLYGGIAREVAVRLKHGRRIGLARLMANAMARLAEGDEGGRLLVPVPLHRWRIWRRGFNQSALIARHLAEATGIDFAPHALTRVKQTPILAGLGAKQRAEALRGAFKVLPERRTLVRDRHILLIDDVYTSGATGNAAALALKRGGASRVTLICWARVIKADDH
jgi:ComF family protein